MSENKDFVTVITLQPTKPFVVLIIKVMNTYMSDMVRTESIINRNVCRKVWLRNVQHFAESII